MVGVNSARPNPVPWRSSGRIPEQQIAALHKIAIDARISQRLVCIMTHYAPLLAGGKPDTRLHGLRNGEEFLAACADFKKAILLCGHVHHCYTVKVMESGQSIFCAGSVTMEGEEGFWFFDVQEDTLCATPGIWNGEGFALDNNATVKQNLIVTHRS